MNNSYSPFECIALLSYNFLLIAWSNHIKAPNTTMYITDHCQFSDLHGHR